MGQLFSIEGLTLQLALQFSIIICITSIRLKMIASDRRNAFIYDFCVPLHRPVEN